MIFLDGYTFFEIPRACDDHHAPDIAVPVPMYNVVNDFHTPEQGAIVVLGADADSARHIALHSVAGNECGPFGGTPSTARPPN